VPWHAGPGDARRGSRVVSRQDLGSSPSLARGRGWPQQAGPPCQREGEWEEGKQATWAERARASCLGRAERRERRRRKEASWLMRRRKERPARAGPQGKMEEGKRKRKVGRAQLGNEREKEMHLNLNLKFKFKWKSINKTMQWAGNAQNLLFLIFLFMFY
jgi:hypothetical protein